MAQVINFLMEFPSSIDIMGFTLQLFKRLYNTYLSFRPKLEDAMISCFFNILKNYKACLDE